MTPRLAGILFVIAAMAVESLAQLALKVGSSGGPSILAGRFRDLASSLAFGRSASVWIALGVAAYVLEIFLYTLALQRLDVSVAFPLGSLCFVGVALLSRVFLAESVGTVRWLGVLTILAGGAVTAL